jgi:hypothetical protein
LVFVNYCPKVHKPHFCSHGFGGNSLGEKGENKGKKDTYSPIPQGENSPNSPNSPIPQGENSPKGEIPSLVAIPPRGKIPQRRRKIPQRGKLGEKTSQVSEESVSKNSSWTGHLLLIGGLGLLATLIFFGLRASKSDSTNSSGSNTSSPPPSNPYDFSGVSGYGVESLDQLTRYNV